MEVKFKEQHVSDGAVSHGLGCFRKVDHRNLKAVANLMRSLPVQKENTKTYAGTAVVERGR